jgi:uncharacterized protein DUF4157
MRKLTRVIQKNAAQHSRAPGDGLMVQRAANREGRLGKSEPPPMVHGVLRSPGHLLDAQSRSFMESRFGHDFSGVRLHTDVKAAESARSLGARAYTVGRDIVFGAGQYAPYSPAGRKLMAHELTHVVQQGTSRTTGSKNTLTSPALPVLETEAHQAAEAVYDPRDLPEISLAPSLAIQRWDSPEHVSLGEAAAGSSADLIILECHDRDLPQRQQPIPTWPAEWQALYNRGTPEQRRAITRGLTYGEIVALFGDFYADFDALNHASLREIYDLIPLIRSEATTTELQAATGGRYLALAEVNESHFTSVRPGRSNRDTWRNMHMQAIQAARQGNANLARGINAAADHFLTDAFSGGHIRTPRATLMQSTMGNIESKILHDLDNEYGVEVANARGDRWIAYGDDMLADRRNVRNQQLVIEAVQLSQQDISNALSQRTAYPSPNASTVFAAEQLIPYPVDPSRDRWTGRTPTYVSTPQAPGPIRAVDDYTRMRDRIVIREAPGIAGGFFNDDNQIRAWVARQSLSAIARQPAAEKTRMINTLLNGWISDDDVISIERICLSVPSSSEMATIRAEITPRITEMTSIGQRTRVRVALSRL